MAYLIVHVLLAYMVIDVMVIMVGVFDKLMKNKIGAPDQHVF